jgi:hypothetical protein
MPTGAAQARRTPGAGWKPGAWVVLAGCLISVVCAGWRGSAEAAPTPISCSTSVAAPPVVRAEGLTELVGDLTLTCSGGTPPAAGQAVPTSNFTLFFNTAVTSRMVRRLVPKGLPPQTVEASLDAGGKTYRGVVSGNSITFFGIPTPGTTPPATDVYQFAHIRVNASELAGGSSGNPAPVIASLSVSGTTSMTFTNPTPMVATVQPGLTFSVRDAGDAAPLTSVPPVPCTGAPVRIGTASFVEQFGAAFKTRVDENGSQPSGTGADFGTRLELTFSNVPKGVTVFVDRNAGTGQSSAELTASDTGEYSGVPASPGAPGDSAPVSLVNGAGTAVWEVLNENPAVIEKLDVGIYASRAAGSGAGSAQLAGGFGPTSTGAAATATDGPIPRFGAPSGSPTPLLFSSCPTATTTTTTTATNKPTTTTTTSSTTTTLRDHTPPRLTVHAAALQHILRQHALLVSVHCNERCTLTLSARAGSTARFATARASLPGGRSASFALTLSKTARARVVHSLGRHAPVTARITIRGRDAAGNVTTTTRTVELVR